MAYCDTCFDGAKFKNIDYEQVKKQAKDYAVTKKQDVAIYQENGVWLFCEVQTAISNQLPIREIVSQYSWLTSF